MALLAASLLVLVITLPVNQIMTDSAGQTPPPTENEAISDISPYHITNRQDSATVQRTVRKSKIRGGSEFETQHGHSD